VLVALARLPKILNRKVGWRKRKQELAELSAYQVAEELNRRKIVGVAGGNGYTATVIKLRERSRGQAEMTLVW